MGKWKHICARRSCLLRWTWTLIDSPIAFEDQQHGRAAITGARAHA